MSQSSIPDNNTGKKKKRSIAFYTELILATVVSLIAANAWITWMKLDFAKYYKNSMTPIFIYACIITILAIVLLTVFFSEEDSILTKSNKNISQSAIILPIIGDERPYNSESYGQPEVRNVLYTF